MSAFKLLLGADPELFLRDKAGKIVSAHDIIPGTKIEPYKVAKGAIQVDGAAAEFNIDPAESSLGFVNNIATVMADLRSRIGDLEFVLNPTTIFDPDYFKSLPENVRELGCNPDFNAYTRDVNPPPDGDSTTMRTASGHIHIGWCEGVNPLDPIHFDDCCEIIKQLDFFLGLYSLVWDPDGTRRQLYGKAGAFRPKPYGVEYRTMSNVWLRSPRVQGWIFQAAKTAVNSLMSETKSFYSRFGDFAKDSINNNDTKWYESKIGKTVQITTGLSWPDISECVNYGKLPPSPPKKKIDPKHLYKKSLLDSAATGVSIDNTFATGTITIG